MSEQQIKKASELQDSPTHRYDLMQMRVDEIQGLITVLQQRRTLHVSKESAIRTNSKISSARERDKELDKFMTKIEKLITRMNRDDEAITKLLNGARGLLLDASDGTLILEKTDESS